MKSTRLASSPPRLAKWPWRAPTSTVLIEGVRQLGHVPSIPITPPSNVPLSMAAALPEVEKCVTHRMVSENGLWAKCDCHSPPMHQDTASASGPSKSQFPLPLISKWHGLESTAGRTVRNIARAAVFTRLAKRSIPRLTTNVICLDNILKFENDSSRLCLVRGRLPVNSAATDDVAGRTPPCRRHRIG